jgi:hypothetical protein
MMESFLNINKAEELLTKKENFFQRNKTLCKSELIYLPYYLFSAEIHLSSNKTGRFFLAVDTIAGECAHIKNVQRFLDQSFSKSQNFIISEEEAGIIAKKFFVNEILYKKRKGVGFIKTSITLEKVFEYPYWIGYFRRGDGIDFNVIDGLTGQRQGPKMKSVFIKYLMQ